MDTSPEYIKMCEQAVEVQEGHPQKYQKCHHITKGSKGDTVWLLTQDQLQGMLEGETKHGEGYKCRLYEEEPICGNFMWMTKKAIRFFNEVGGECFPCLEGGVTGEVFWLAFVMKEKFNKTWKPETKEWEEQ